LDAGGSSSSGTITLPPAVVRELFIRLLLLSPQLACADLRALLLHVLQNLVATGGVLQGLVFLHTHGSDAFWVLSASATKVQGHDSNAEFSKLCAIPVPGH
jgi:hypothetical protein